MVEWVHLNFCGSHRVSEQWSCRWPPFARWRLHLWVMRRSACVGSALDASIILPQCVGSALHASTTSSGMVSWVDHNATAVYILYSLLHFAFYPAFPCTTRSSKMMEPPKDVWQWLVFPPPVTFPRPPRSCQHPRTHLWQVWRVLHIFLRQEGLFWCFIIVL